MKAVELLKTLLLKVRPPRGIAIRIIEMARADSNWEAAAGPMPDKHVVRFALELAKLRRSGPLVDWSGVNEKCDGLRSAAAWLSEMVDADFDCQAVVWGALGDKPQHRNSLFNAIVDVMAHPEWSNATVEADGNFFDREMIEALSRSAAFARHRHALAELDQLRD